MDISLAADRRRIAELACHLLDRILEDALRGGLGPRPGPEVLRGDVATRNVAEIVVHVGRADLARLAVIVHILEEKLARQLLDRLDDARDAAVADRQPPGLAALALEVEAKLGSVDV